MNEIGKLLKNTRESLDYSIDEISNKLLIRKKYLIALEESDYNNLPAAVYINCYIKAYAKLLNIETTDVADVEQNIPENYINLPCNKEYRPGNILIISSLLVLLFIYTTWNSSIFNRNIYNNKFNNAQELKEIQSASFSNIKKFYNKDQFAVLAKNDCNIRVFDKEGKLFEDKKLNSGEIYYMPNKLELTIAISNKDKIEIFNNKDYKI